MPNAASFNHNALHHILTSIGIIIHTIAEAKSPSSTTFVLNSNHIHNTRNDPPSPIVNSSNGNDSSIISSKRSIPSFVRKGGDDDIEEQSSAYRSSDISNIDEESFEEDNGLYEQKS